ncbi:unnamed protein product [Aphis gossypii]|uniref:Uncharacterized protein n=1 Tax=Aphis gossypii TaxID=80765 RepID=A0A9P0IM01_APHGO|nr:unnamed protein product [Aphis gossypii]
MEILIDVHVVHLHDISYHCRYICEIDFKLALILHVYYYTCVQIIITVN